MRSAGIVLARVEHAVAQAVIDVQRVAQFLVRLPHIVRGMDIEIDA